MNIKHLLRIAALAAALACLTAGLPLSSPAWAQSDSKVTSEDLNAKPATASPAPVSTKTAAPKTDPKADAGVTSEDLKPEQTKAQPPAWLKTDPTVLRENLTARAKAGDIEAQARLGAALRRGWPGPRDTFRALAWTRAATEAGNFFGRVNLAAHLYFGQGVTQDKTAAARLAAQSVPELTQAAQKGDPEMMTCLAWLYSTGLGVKKDPARAADWLERAVAVFYPPAQTDLAILLLKGEGLKADPVRAAHLLARAAAAKMAKAQYLLGRLHDLGRGVPRDPETARQWYQLAADQGFKAAQARLQ